MNDHILGGRSITGIVQGDSDPQQFIPDLIELYRQGKFPFDELITYYGFEDIEQAVEDSESGETIKTVLRVGDAREYTDNQIGLNRRASSRNQTSWYSMMDILIFNWHFNLAPNGALPARLD